LRDEGLTVARCLWQLSLGALGSKAGTLCSPCRLGMRQAARGSIFPSDPEIQNLPVQQNLRLLQMSPDAHCVGADHYSELKR